MKLRDQNKTLEDKLSTANREKTKLMKENVDYEKKRKDMEFKLSEMDKQSDDMESERGTIIEQLESIDKERILLTEKLSSNEAQLQSLRKSYDDIKKEKDMLSRKLKTVEQKETALKQREETILKEIDTSVSNVLRQCPSLKQSENITQRASLPAEVNKMLSLHKCVVSEHKSLRDEVSSFKATMNSNTSKLEKQRSNVLEKERLYAQLKKDSEERKRSLTNRIKELETEREKLLATSREESEQRQKELTELLQANETLEEDIEEVSASYHSMLNERNELKSLLSQKEHTHHFETGPLLVKIALISAQLRLLNETLSRLGGEELVDKLAALTAERDELVVEVDVSKRKCQEVTCLLEETKEEMRKCSLETDKIKVRLMTEISLLKSQVSTLEKEKSSLEVSQFYSN